jgi:phosphoserine aminotransferase
MTEKIEFKDTEVINNDDQILHCDTFSRSFSYDIDFQKSLNYRMR